MWPSETRARQEQGKVFLELHEGGKPFGEIKLEAAKYRSDKHVSWWSAHLQGYLLLRSQWFSHFVNYYFLKFLPDQVFGANLSNLCQRENSTVPKFVKLCIEHVEQYGKKKNFFWMLSTPAHCIAIKTPRIFDSECCDQKFFLVVSCQEKHLFCKKEKTYSFVLFQIKTFAVICWMFNT